MGSRSFRAQDFWNIDRFLCVWVYVWILFLHCLSALCRTLRMKMSITKAKRTILQKNAMLSLSCREACWLGGVTAWLFPCFLTWRRTGEVTLRSFIVCSNNFIHILLSPCQNLPKKTDQHVGFVHSSHLSGSGELQMYIFDIIKFVTLLLWRILIWF